MTVKEFVDKKIKELEAQNYRSVQLREVIECELSNHSFSYALFGARTPEMTEEVIEDYRTNEPFKCKGVMVILNVIKPRCRKITTEHFRARLVGEANG